MIKRKSNPLRDISLFIGVASLLLYGLVRLKTSAPDKKEAATKYFLQTEIKGRLVFKRLQGGYARIGVDNRTDTFVFRPAPSGDGSFFHAQADIGDSLFKLSNDPFLTVKQGHATYTYPLLP